jgi:hypothetical protein
VQRDYIIRSENQVLEVTMTKLKSHLWLAVLLLACTAWLGNEAPVRAQEPGKILEIARYPDEPLQIVNLRIGTLSVKDDIKQKFKDPRSKWGIDSVKFEGNGRLG